MNIRNQHIDEYRKWIANYKRPSGPQTLITPQGWRDALEWALDEIEYLEDLLSARQT